jgi:hypothetical protein
MKIEINKIDGPDGPVTVTRVSERYHVLVHMDMSESWALDGVLYPPDRQWQLETDVYRTFSITWDELQERIARRYEAAQQLWRHE